MVEHISVRLYFSVVSLLVSLKSNLTIKSTKVSIKISRDVNEKSTLFEKCPGDLDAIL